MNPKQMRKRKSFSKKARADILSRTDFRCYSCGLPMKMEDDWWIEHILPHSHKGSDDVTNLLPSCRLCNFVRGNRPPEEVRKMLLVGYALMPEIRKGTPLGKSVEEHLEKRERRLAKARKHPVLAMNEAASNTLRELRKEASQSPNIQTDSGPLSA